MPLVAVTQQVFEFVTSQRSSRSPFKPSTMNVTTRPTMTNAVAEECNGDRISPSINVHTAMRGGVSSPGLYHPVRLSYDYVMVNSRHSGEMSSQRRTVSDGHDSIEQSNEQSLSFSLRHPFISV